MLVGPGERDGGPRGADPLRARRSPARSRPSARRRSAPRCPARSCRRTPRRASACARGQRAGAASTRTCCATRRCRRARRVTTAQSCVRHRASATSSAPRRSRRRARSPSASSSARATQLLVAQAQLATARAQLANAQKQLDKASVQAPFAGVVAQRQVNAGDVVSPGTALFTVVDPASMQLEASRAGRAAGAGARRRCRSSSRVNGYPNRTFTGRITRVNPVADPATRQVQIIAAIPNAGNTLVGGLFAEGRVASESRNAPMVPIGAVDERGLRPTVVRLQERQDREGRSGARHPRRGGRDGGDHAAASRRATRVLLGAARGISPGTPVKVSAPTDVKEVDRSGLRPLTGHASMFISDFAIKRPLITVVAMVALVVFGLFALLKLKTDEFPDVAPPFVHGRRSRIPGASPDGVEKEILDPIEEQIASITGVKHVTGKAYDGFGSSSSSSSSTRISRRRRRTCATRSRRCAPTCRRRWRSRSSRSSTTPTGRSCRWRSRRTTLSPAELTRLADPGITRELRSIPGVAEVQVSRQGGARAHGGARARTRCRRRA